MLIRYGHDYDAHTCPNKCNGPSWEHVYLIVTVYNLCHHEIYLKILVTLQNVSKHKVASIYINYNGIIVSTPSVQFSVSLK